MKKIGLAVAALVLAPSIAYAGHGKAGLWNISTTVDMGGMQMPPEAMDALISSIGRTPIQRTTLYGSPRESQCAKSYGAQPLTPVRERRRPIRRLPGSPIPSRPGRS